MTGQTHSAPLGLSCGGYIQANRARTTAMELAAKVFEQVDVIVGPRSARNC